MGRWDNLGGYNGTSWSTPDQVKYYNGTSWVDMGHDDDIETDYAAGIFNVSTKTYGNELYRYDGSNWAQVSKNPTYIGEVYMDGEMTRPVAEYNLNPSYYSSSSASYYYFEFQGYVRATDLPIRLFGAYRNLSYPKGYGTSTSGISTNAISNLLYQYEWDMWVTPNGYIAFRTRGSGNAHLKYSLNKITDWTTWHYIKCGSYRPTYASSFSSSYRWTGYCSLDGSGLSVMRTTEGGSSSDTSSTGYHYGMDHGGILGSNAISGATLDKSQMYGTITVKSTGSGTSMQTVTIDTTDGTLYNILTTSSNGTWTTAEVLRQDYTW